jgi:hypothetical protein
MFTLSSGMFGERLRLPPHFNHAADSYSVTQTFHALCLGAVLATEEGTFLFEPVTDYVNAAMPASWSECVNRTFEAVKDVGSAVHDHLKGLVVVVSASFTSCHDDLPFTVGQPAPIGRVPQTEFSAQPELCGSLRAGAPAKPITVILTSQS